MSSVLAPTGLTPVSHPSGIDRATIFNATTYASGTATKLYNTATTFYDGMPLTITAAGLVDVAPSVAAAGSNTRIYGVFKGAEFTDAVGRRAVSSWYVDSLASTTTDPNVWFWIYTDPNQVFEIQAEGSITGAAIGGEFNFSATAGRLPSSGTVIPGGVGYSTCALNPTEVATGTQGQVRVVEIGRGIDNAFGDTYTKVRVVMANYVQYVPAPNQ